ncbi:MAG TPA: recombinase family protein [Mycobacteriales bacterium]|nr:recombinase family protein [Mycobacteriales bacterium]
MNVLGYVRCSTAEQGRSGLGLDAQRQAIEDACARNGWTLVEVVEDVASGKSMRREGLTRALAALDGGAVDGLVTAKLDRLSRSVLDFATLVCRAQQQTWNLVVLDLGLDLSTPQGRFTAHVLCAMAELERELIGQRTRDALAMAKQRGVRLGRPSRVSAEVAVRIREERAAGRTLAAIASALNDDAVSPPSGGQAWYPAGIARVLRAAG